MYSLSGLLMSWNRNKRWPIFFFFQDLLHNGSQLLVAQYLLYLLLIFTIPDFFSEAVSFIMANIKWQMQNMWKTHCQLIWNFVLPFGLALPEWVQMANVFFHIKWQNVFRFAIIKEKASELTIRIKLVSPWQTAISFA